MYQLVLQIFEILIKSKWTQTISNQMIWDFQKLQDEAFDPEDQVLQER